MLLFPLGFPLLFGYAVEAVRSSARDDRAGPPSWRISRRLIRDGFAAALLPGAVSLVVGLAFWPLATALYAAHYLVSTGDPFFDRIYSLLAALGLAALPWGLAMLLLVPAGLARYAAGGRVGDLFDLRATLRLVRCDFTAWNLALATIVTAWAMGLAAGGLLCLGLIPGVFYAILVSAHATARLRPASGPPASDPAAG